MVYLLKMVIFHGYVSHNQRVNVLIEKGRLLRWNSPMRSDEHRLFFFAQSDRYH